MSIIVKYHLKLKNIMGKNTDTFDFENNMTLREVLEKNLDVELFQKICSSDLLIISEGINYNNLDINVENGKTYCLCPKLYGG